jgi:AcrR family transcriptional regulator
VAKTLVNGRREELLDGIMAIISARGFSETRIVDVASELNCSASTLYKVAPNKDSLVVLAIGRWGDRVLAYMESRAQQGATASEKARKYWWAAAESLRPMSSAFRSDMERFESTRIAYKQVSDRFIERFAQLVDDAVSAGEVRPINTRFLALLVRQQAIVVRDEAALADCGLTAEQAMLEVDQMIWNGVCSS